MDIATVMGFVAAWVLIIGSILYGGQSLMLFIDIPSIAIVFGGCLAVLFMCFPLKSVVSTMPKALLKAVFYKSPDLKALIKQIVGLAETARRDGLLALESKIEELQHPILKAGIQMAVDGARPEVIEEVIRTDVSAMNQRHNLGKSLMDQAGRFAPAYGMIGTLLGLIMMLADMSDPSAIGKGMAVALITTLYGAIAANVVFQPFAEKLALTHRQEVASIELILRGVIAIQSGETPRVIQQKLNSFVPAKQRDVEA